jgi:hypothetical protein
VRLLAGDLGEPLEPRAGIPLPRSRITFPDCVPAGIFIFMGPSSVGTSICAPSAACVKLMGSSQTTSLSSRRKMGWSRTWMTTYRSPGEAPGCGAGSPSPASLRRVPVSTPAGTVTSKVARSWRMPAPPQSSHLSTMTRPMPPHWWHVRAMEKKPCVMRISPTPPQVGQVRGPVPGFAPVPLHESQRFGRAMSMREVVPNAASSKLTSRW